MKGDAKVIQHLNAILRNELTAINQYFLHARLLENWGATKMARHEYKESIEEMQHADKLIQRIILIEGHPNLQDLGKLNIGENVREVIECDMMIEKAAIPELKAAIKDCETAFDYVSRDLLISILHDEEHHLDHLETQLQLVNDIGIQNYIQLNADAQGSLAEGEK
jgi:bacterioferritin